jgi:aryl-alcohol dehydrogenase-like predicted oxidoreductase
MQMRSFGRLGQVSALTLGGGGIGNVWGAVERAEAVATVRAALDAGITMLDVAPTYGPGEAEMVVGEALDGAVPEGVLITTKVELPDAEPEALERRIAESLRASMERLRVERIDLLLLHSQLQPDDWPTAARLLSVEPFRNVVRPAFERLVEEGAIGGWGLTGVGHPRALIDVLSDDSLPYGIQCVANALDLSGDMWVFGPDERPDNAGVRKRAVQAGVPVIGIRAVAAGSLTDALDRSVEADHPAARDFEAAAPFRRFAAERGESAALLAHRYALSMDEPATVVIGVKNRAELEECLAAEAAGPLADDELRAIDAMREAPASN